MSSILFADTFRLPFPSSTYGNRFGVKGPLYGRQGHRGTDFRVAGGTNIPVIANGEVVHVMWSDVLGRVTVVRHYIHGENNDVYSGYCHQSAQIVRVGQQVKTGQTIGRVGGTGSASTGNHLHLTMSFSDMGVEYGEVFDPIPYIEAHDSVPAPVKKAVFTTARRGEGLSAIAARAKITLARIKALNPDIKSPRFIVQLGQKVRVR